MAVRQIPTVRVAQPFVRKQRDGFRIVRLHLPFVSNSGKLTPQCTAEIAPDCPYAAGKLGYLKLLCCDWRDYHAEQIQLVEAVAAGRRACDPFSFTAMSNTAAAQLA